MVYFRKNIAVVHIFFIDNSYMKYSKNELYGFAELLCEFTDTTNVWIQSSIIPYTNINSFLTANTGGLLGLFMGFSLLSVIEIVYYFIIRIWWRVWRKKANKHEKSRHIIRPLGKRHDAVYPFAK